MRARGFTDADDIAAVLHYRITKATARPAGSGRARKTPRLIAGLIPEATGTMTTETRQALTERRDLIEARADTQLASALQDSETWTVALGSEPRDAKAAMIWRRHARTVAAYRDRYNITGPHCSERQPRAPHRRSTPPALVPPSIDCPICPTSPSRWCSRK